MLACPGPFSLHRVINGNIKYSGIVCHSFRYSTQFQLVSHVHTTKRIEMDTFISKNTHNVSITTSNKESRFVCTQFNNSIVVVIIIIVIIFIIVTFPLDPQCQFTYSVIYYALPNSTHFLPLSTPSLTALPLCLHLKHFGKKSPPK